MGTVTFAADLIEYPDSNIIDKHTIIAASKDTLIIKRVMIPNTLISIMVTSNETNVGFKPLLILNKSQKSIWLVISEAGDAVCGVV